MKEKKELIYRNEGFWLAPTGEIFRVPISHMDTLLDSPERFGLTLQAIEDEYRRRGEALGMEGRARDTLIQKVVARGWIRMRHHIGDGWEGNVPDFTAETLGKLYNFLGSLGGGAQHEPIVLKSSRGGRRFTSASLLPGA